MPWLHGNALYSAPKKLSAQEWIVHEWALQQLGVHFQLYGERFELIAFVRLQAPGVKHFTQGTRAING